MFIQDVRKSAFAELEKIKNFEEKEHFRARYLGRKGQIAELLAGLTSFSMEERKSRGAEINKLKNDLEAGLRGIEEGLEQEARKMEKRLDITAPGLKIKLGRLHILTKVRRRIERIFHLMGFSVIEGPEAETEHYSFDALNIPANHPARDLWDTFWLKDGKNLLLRPHTSPVQIHYMESHQPPFKIIAPGRCFRYEATDASHDIQFHQVEGLMVGKKVSVANFKGVLESFFEKFFAKELKLKLRPSYFPFVEPGFEVDISCPRHTGAKCSLCGGNGYLEVMGAGMVHPNVFLAVGYDPREWQGFAFGLGLERLAMIKHRIDDIRLFSSGDLKFLKQF